MWQRTAKRQHARFDTSFAAARDGLLNELRLLGARDVIISSNVPLRRDGLPHATQRDPDDPGVCVYFTLDGEERALPCDRWLTVKDNLRALQHTVAALRGLDRWGSPGLVNAAFAGFAALPESTATPAWWDRLGVSRDASKEAIDQAFRRLAFETHPDAGGDTEAFLAVQDAYRQARGGR
jgi:hypothetical protein